VTVNLVTVAVCAALIGSWLAVSVRDVTHWLARHHRQRRRRDPRRNGNVGLKPNPNRPIPAAGDALDALVPRSEAAAVGGSKSWDSRLPALRQPGRAIRTLLADHGPGSQTLRAYSRVA
jgi:hypothetical protein